MVNIGPGQVVDMTPDQAAAYWASTAPPPPAQSGPTTLVPAGGMPAPPADTYAPCSPTDPACNPWIKITGWNESWGTQPPNGPDATPDPTHGYAPFQDPIAKALLIDPANPFGSPGFQGYNIALNLYANQHDPNAMAKLNFLLANAVNAIRSGTFGDLLKQMQGMTTTAPPGALPSGYYPDQASAAAAAAKAAGLPAPPQGSPALSITDILRSIFGSSGPAMVPGGASGGTGTGTSTGGAPSAPLFAMSDVTGWLKGSTLITGVPNWGLVAVVIGGVVFFMLRRGK